LSLPDPGPTASGNGDVAEERLAPEIHHTMLAAQQAASTFATHVQMHRQPRGSRPRMGW
jgi:hypothetical protein